MSAPQPDFTPIGNDLIRELRGREAALGAGLARKPHLPAIALASFAREQAAAAGFDAHCAKPPRPLDVVQQIRQLPDRRH